MSGAATNARARRLILQRHPWMIVLLALGLLPALVRAEVRTQELPYSHGDTELVGYLAYDDAATGPRPAIVIYPEWWGLNDYAKSRARQLAAMGFVVLAADMYGDGRSTTRADEAGAMAGPFNQDRAMMRARAMAAVGALKAQNVAPVDNDRVAVMGYCFGGTISLELARAGAEIVGAASFHGGLTTTMPVKKGESSVPILVLHGLADPLEPIEEVKTFLEEMNAAGMNVTFIAYGNAVHSFTNPNAGRANIPGVAYDAAADAQSFEHLKLFLDRVLASK